MRTIKESTLAAFAARYPQAATGLEVCRRIMRQEQFRHFADFRRCFRSADQVRVASGNPVVVFNICGNTTGSFALSLRFLTHAEYDKDRWKDEL